MTTNRVTILPDLPKPVSKGDDIKVRLHGETYRQTCSFLYADLKDDGTIDTVTVLDSRYRHFRTVRPDAVDWPEAPKPPKLTPTGRLKKVKPRQFKAARYHYERDDYGCKDTKHCVHVKDSRKGNLCGCCGSSLPKGGK